MKKLFCTLALVAFATASMFAGSKVIAHRGYWTTPGSAQNSRTSLQKALDLNIYGSEIDVWLTTDGKLMVNHDADFNGVVLEKASYKECKNLTLKNGEKMPQLKDLLKMMKKTKSKTKLIIEIKTHSTLEANKRAVQATVNAVKKYGIQDKVEYIAFSHDVCLELVRLDKQAKVAYLSGNKTPAQLHQEGITGIDYHIGALRKHPEWIKEAHDLGMTVNVWTVSDKAGIEEMNKAGVDYITTNEPVLAIELTR